uniref:Uncharacterized protein n=1 Tax=viral metagenome TaxID=1070528 RepID=A0A6M3X5T3_9ZZZZ
MELGQRIREVMKMKEKLEKNPDGSRARIIQLDIKEVILPEHPKK